jgi:hypothetical protein
MIIISCLTIDPKIVQSSPPSAAFVWCRDQNLVATTKGVKTQNMVAGIRIRGVLSCPMLFSVMVEVIVEDARRNPRHPALGVLLGILKT